MPAAELNPNPRIQPAMARTREPPPPPVIGKYGLYTVFITPPSAPNSVTSVPNPTPIPQKDAPLAPIQVPPQQFEKHSRVGVFWEAVAKVQDGIFLVFCVSICRIYIYIFFHFLKIGIMTAVHARLDAYLADWFGLNQSKYQWALDDYNESNAMVSDLPRNLCLFKFPYIREMSKIQKAFCKYAGGSSFNVLKWYHLCLYCFV